MSYKVLGLIPARGGSKSIPRKNLQLLDGKPLLAHSIEHSLNSAHIQRTIVSTDDEEIAALGRKFGAEVPFMRPSELASDESSDLEVFQHSLNWLSRNESYVPDICIHLRPTHPIRKVDDIDKIIRILMDHPEIDSVRSIVPAPETPFKMWFRNEEGFLTSVVPTQIKGAHSLPRQLLPEVFLQNASVDAIWSREILGGSMTGNKIYGYLMDDIFDIDTENDLNRVRQHANKG